MTGSQSALSLFLVAAEPSGDELGAALCRELEAILGREGVEFHGVGGPRMAAFGVPQPFDISELSVLGLVEGLKAYPKVIKRADQMAELAQLQPLHGAVLIDSWGFTLRVAKRLRRAMPELPIIKYVGPQVWASRPGRARALAEVADTVLTLQPFEPAYFERAGMHATFVGHPTLDKAPEGDGQAFRQRYGLKDKTLVLCLFGSRRAEWTHLGATLIDAVGILHARYGDRLAFVAPLSHSLATQIRAGFAGIDPATHPIILMDEVEKSDAFNAANMALACSGTVVTQLASHGVPTVVAYRLSALNHAVVRLYVKAPHISLVNMALGERAFPEFVQGQARPEALADALSLWIDDSDLAQDVSAKGLQAVARMRGQGGAARRAAEAVLDAVRSKNAAE
jgi:lipid-A-disaccharide synthase